MRQEKRDWNQIWETKKIQDYSIQLSIYWGIKKKLTHAQHGLKYLLPSRVCDGCQLLTAIRTLDWSSPLNLLLLRPIHFLLLQHLCPLCFFFCIVTHNTLDKLMSWPRYDYQKEKKVYYFNNWTCVYSTLPTDSPALWTASNSSLC